ncbi:MAG: tetratricopeptide repeat protein [Pseudohongiellaceae bacterium]
MVGKKTNLYLVSAFVSFLTSLSASGCPDLNGVYQLLDDSPSLAQAQLSALLDQCSQSSEYFALLGASQLATGDLFQALENLELALLINPENGAASVDYAEVLYQQGQVLSALEINEQLIAREDLPEGLKAALTLRQRRWSSSRIVKNFSLAAFAGFDDNLNSAPVSDQLSLTLSGKSVTLDVSPDYQAKGGSYSRLVTSASYRRFGRTVNAHVSGQLSARFADDSRYELVQASTQANIGQASDRPRWDVVAGLDHVIFGGNTIFSSATSRFRYIVRRTDSCGFYPRFAAQYQYFHTQRTLSGIEMAIGLGADCTLFGGGKFNRFALELTALTNRATETNRLGRDRDGWRLNVVWRRPAWAGEVLGQYVLTQLNDEAGYSPLFDRGAKRKESLNSVFFQYMRPLSHLGENAQFFTNLSYHSQDSTIDLFKIRGTSLEIGINWNF